MKILINSTSGEQILIEVGMGGDYVDKAAIQWHEGYDGEIKQNITLGKMQRQGSKLVELPNFLPEHVAAIAKKSAEEVKIQKHNDLTQELRSNPLVSQLREMDSAGIEAWLDANATTLKEMRSLFKIVAKILIVNNKG